MKAKGSFFIVILTTILFLNQCIKFEDSILDPNSTLSNLILLNRISSSVASTNYTLTISPDPTHYTTPQYITMTATEGLKIYFTTDGTEPTVSSNLYKEPIHIWKLAGVQLRAIATKNDVTLVSLNQNNYYSYPNLKTGKTACWDQLGNAVTPCNVSTGQDGGLQKGVTRSYNGPIQHANYPNDYTTTDEATGLIWKSCTQGQTGESCAGAAVTQDWTTAQTGVGGCNELNTLNAGAGYAGRTDWRLPSVVELRTLLDFSGINLNNTVPRINTTAFPNTQAGSGNAGIYWTATNSAAGFFPFNVDFSTALTTFLSITPATPLNVRCVAGIPSYRVYEYTDNGDLTVTDHKTRLTWEKCTYVQSGQSCAGSGSTAQWDFSIAYCNSLALGSKTWRLPSANELDDFLNFLKFDADPRVDLSFFPNTPPSNGYWSSTTSTALPDFKIMFGSNGNISSNAGNTLQLTRCVAD